MNNIPSNYKPLSAWAYFAYNILFSIPIIGFVLLIVFSFDNSNINRRNYARSFWCVILLVIIIITVISILGISTTRINEIKGIINAY